MYNIYWNKFLKSCLINIEYGNGNYVRSCTYTHGGSPQFGIHKAVKSLKGYTSKVLRDEYPALKTKMLSLWTNSYFVSSVGGASKEVIKQYIVKILFPWKRWIPLRYSSLYATSTGVLSTFSKNAPHARYSRANTITISPTGLSIRETIFASWKDTLNFRSSALLRYASLWRQGRTII